DESLFDDAGETITAKFESSVIPVLGQQMAVAGQQRMVGPMDHLVVDGVQVQFVDRGANYTIAVDVSGDGGVTWNAIGTATVLSLGTPEATDARIVSMTVRGRVPVRDSVQVRLSNLTTGIPWGFAGGYIYVDVVGRKVA